jgi:hypothetical protein
MTEITMRDALQTQFLSCLNEIATDAASRPRAIRPEIMCHVPGHGPIINRSDAMGDSYCPDCQVRHARVYGSSRATPGRRIVAAEAIARGGVCQFILVFSGDLVTRCQSRFHDGRLEWHHRDPQAKIATISALADGPNRAVLLTELAKCDLLCRAHHRIVQKSPPDPSRWLIAARAEVVLG